MEFRVEKLDKRENRETDIKWTPAGWPDTFSVTLRRYQEPETDHIGAVYQHIIIPGARGATMAKKEGVRVGGVSPKSRCRL